MNSFVRFTITIIVAIWNRLVIFSNLKPTFLDNYTVIHKVQKFNSHCAVMNVEDTFNPA